MASVGSVFSVVALPRRHVSTRRRLRGVVVRAVQCRIECRRGEFWPGPVIAEFALAEAWTPATLAP